ncbi:MAG: hypothetical protein PVG07_02360 [Acidobacteriota bacterium]|jgi:hypothetical protein
MSTHEPEDRSVGSFDEVQLIRLREAFHVDTERPDPAACPTAGRLWHALRGESSADEVRRVLDHLVDCPACAQEWRLGVAFEQEEAAPGARSAEDLPEPGASEPGRGRIVRFPTPLLVRAAAAAAAVLALGVAGVWWSLQPAPEEISPAVYRQGGETAGESIESLLPENEPIPRAEPVLRWAAVPAGSPEGTVYDVLVSTELVSTEAFATVADASGLEEPRYRIPGEALEGLPSGTTLLWRVEAITAEGRRVTSPTFETPLE